MTKAIYARLSRPADHRYMSAAPDSVAIVYSAGVAVITASRSVDTVAIAVTIVDCAAFAVITIFGTYLHPVTGSQESTVQGFIAQFDVFTQAVPL